jgi:acyl-CoA reductase-like NAD-dependent aldehyde dehydrogenase
VQRIYVQEAVAAEFTKRFLSATEALQIGHPMEDSTDISSLISESEAQRVESWIEESIHQGAKLLVGGRRSGATITPAVLQDVPATARMSCEEVFGPVVVLHSFSELNSAVDAVNQTPYGLQAGIFTKDLTRGFEAARRLKVGGVMINDIPGFRADHMPYGGVKNSGLGREGPRYAIEEMTEMKLICWR